MKHLVIPDCQIKPGDSLEFLEHVGNYIVEKKPDVIIHLGDFADMESLSSYDVGKKSFEGRRYTKDIEAARKAMQTLLGPLVKFNKNAQETKKKQYKPRLVFCLGNHEQRIQRAINDDPKLEGLIKYEDLPYEDWEVHDFLKPVFIDGIAYCFAEGEKALTSNYQYVNVEKLKVGDSLVGFTEEGNKKVYQTAIVEAVESDIAQVYTVHDTNCVDTTVTADHFWLVRKFTSTQYEWVQTKDLKIGYEILQPFRNFTRSNCLEMSWLGGILDGEGWISKPNSKQGGIQVGIAQNDGVVFDKICSILTHNHFNFHVSKNSKCNKIQILGSLSEKLRLLVESNSIRLLSKLTPEMFGRLQSTGINSLVTAITPRGEQKIAKIKTSTGTLVVNGQAHHNCHYFPTGVMGRPATTASAMVSKLHMSCIAGHQQGKQVAYGKRPDGSTITCIIAGSCYEHNESYLDHQTNNHFRGFLMAHEVNNGTFDEMFVSLDYLKKRYEIK